MADRAQILRRRSANRARERMGSELKPDIKCPSCVAGSAMRPSRTCPTCKTGTYAERARQLEPRYDGGAA